MTVLDFLGVVPQVFTELIKAHHVFRNSYGNLRYIISLEEIELQIENSPHGMPIGHDGGIPCQSSRSPSSLPIAPRGLRRKSP